MSSRSLHRHDFALRAAIALLLASASVDFAIAQHGTAALVAPTLGRPAFVAPGESFRLNATIPGAGTGETPTIALVRQRPKLRFPLRIEAHDARSLENGGPTSVSVPADTPNGTYDLEIRAGSTKLLSRHCVAVGRIDDSIRVVHLSNMNLGDIAAPRPDGRLIDEVNLLAPTLIVGTGDYLDVTHPDPQRGWNEFVDFACRFDAPLLLACGDHDDMASYSRHIAPGPIGVVDVGPHRAIVLYDTPARPIDADPDQLAWARIALLGPPPTGVSFIVAHDESPNLLRRMHADGVLRKAAANARLVAYFVGGHRDWDGNEYRDTIAAAAPVAYIRTHQSSTAARGGAEGVSHYRVIEIANGRAAPLGDPPATDSFAVGQLHARPGSPCDGSAARCELEVVNNLPLDLPRAGALVFLKRTGTHPPTCHGATLESAALAGEVWACRIKFDLPEFGVRHITLDQGSAPGTVPTATASFDFPARIEFETRRTDDGVEFQTVRTPQIRGSQEGCTIWVSNAAAGDSVLTPLVRLDGNPLAYRPRDGDAPYATAHRLRLKPGERVALQVDLAAVRVRPGRRTMQVYWKGEPHWPPACCPLNVVIKP